MSCATTSGSPARRRAASSASAARARCSSATGASTPASCSAPRRTAGTVTTVEGLASGDGRCTRSRPRSSTTGAAQCGFCIPGQLVAAAALLGHTPHPTRAQIEDGLAGNLCRCAGYEQIFEAVELAAERARSPGTGCRGAGPMSGRIGDSPARVGGIDRVTGRQVYVADLRLDRRPPRQARHGRCGAGADRVDRHDGRARRARRPPRLHRRRPAAAGRRGSGRSSGTAPSSPSARRTTTASRSPPSRPRPSTPPKRLPRSSGSSTSRCPRS